MDEHDITLSLILSSQLPLKHKKEHQQDCRFNLRYISYIHLNECSCSNLIGMCETPNTLFGPTSCIVCKRQTKHLDSKSSQVDLAIIAYMYQRVFIIKTLPYQLNKYIRPRDEF